MHIHKNIVVDWNNQYINQPSSIMKTHLRKVFLLLAVAISGCNGDDSPTSSFLNCRLSSIEYTGPYSNTDTYTYDADGKKIKLTMTETGNPDNFYSEEYEYKGEKLIKIFNDNGTKDLVYKSDKISKVIDKDQFGDLNYTDYYEWAGHILTVTTKDPSSVVSSTATYTFDGDDITREVYSYYSSGVITFKRELDYSDFDEAYNPEYIMYYPFPASLHNYNHIDVADTDFSGITPVSSGFTWEYEVTVNGSNAVSYRVRTRSDNGEELIRTYTYENCE
jgi:hypothetical protein